MTDAIFLPEGDLFRPTDLAGSPWGPGLLHGGPPAALLARAIEHAAAAEPDMHVARFTVDLFRPVPKEPLAVRAQVVRSGQRIRVVEAALFAGNVEVCRAMGLVLRRSDVPLPEHLRHAGPPPQGPHGLDGGWLGDGKGAPPWPGFHTTIEVRRVGGEPGSGRGAGWFRLPCPVVAGEETSPVVLAAAMSDFANGLGHLRVDDGMGFINADITMHLHRYPEGEWIGMDVRSAGQPWGIGMNEATIYDEQGPIGRVSETLLANQRRSPTATE